MIWPVIGSTTKNSATVQASIDHELPRTIPSEGLTLADIVYVGNTLAGSDFEWLSQEHAPDTGEAETIHQRFADLQPEIDADALEMQSVFN